MYMSSSDIKSDEIDNGQIKHLKYKITKFKNHARAEIFKNAIAFEDANWNLASDIWGCTKYQ